MPRKQSARTSKWAVMVALVLLLATTSLTAAQSPDLLLPLVTGEGQPEQVTPDMPLPTEPDPNAPVGDSTDTHSGDYDVPAEISAVDAFNVAQWTVQNNVGIGTQTPTADIDLSRNVNNYTRLLVRNPNSGGAAQSQLYLNTGNPGVVLQQFGANFSASWGAVPLATRARLRTSPTSAGLIVTTGGAAPLILGTADQERLRITPDGKVGIGMTTPAHQLSIAGGPYWTSNQWIGAVDLPNASAIAWRTNNNGYSFGIGQTYDGFYIFHTTTAPGTTGSAALYDLTINNSGQVGIGTTTPQTGYRLHVKGSTSIETGPGENAVVVEQPGGDGVFIIQPGGYGLDVACPCGAITSYPNTGVLVANGNIRVQNGSFIANNITLTVPDYVFEPEYPLMSLDELRTYVTEEKHLPNVPDEEAIRAGGLDLSDFQMKLLEKTEELTLYTLAQDEQITSLQQANEAMQQVVELLQQQNADLEARLTALEAQK